MLKLQTPLQDEYIALTNERNIMASKAGFSAEYFYNNLFYYKITDELIQFIREEFDKK